MKNKVFYRLAAVMSAAAIAVSSFSIPAAAGQSVTIQSTEESKLSGISEFSVAGEPGGIRISFTCNDPRNMVIYIRQKKQLIDARLVAGSWIKTVKSVLIPVADAGNYTVSLNRITEDGKYCDLLYSADLNYTGKTDYLCDDSVIPLYKPAADKAKELVKGYKTPQQKIFAIHKYITSNFKYDYDKAATSGKLPAVDSWQWEQTPKQTYITRMGVCADISILEVMMLRSVGIEAKQNKSHIHSWTEVRFDKKGWRIIDPTFDLGDKITEKSIYRERTSYYTPGNSKEYSVYYEPKVIVKKKPGKGKIKQKKAKSKKAARTTAKSTKK